MDELSCSCLAKAVAPTGGRLISRVTSVLVHFVHKKWNQKTKTHYESNPLRINSYQIDPSRLSPQRENNKALRHQVSTLMTEITGSRAQTLSNVGLNG